MVRLALPGSLADLNSNPQLLAVGVAAFVRSFDMCCLFLH